MTPKQIARMIKRIRKGNAVRVASAEGRTVSAQARQMAAEAIRCRAT